VPPPPREGRADENDESTRVTEVTETRYREVACHPAPTTHDEDATPTRVDKESC
jgi:hypothetical protein